MFIYWNWPIFLQSGLTAAVQPTANYKETQM